eukprot:gene3119-4255_t
MGGPSSHFGFQRSVEPVGPGADPDSKTVSGVSGESGSASIPRRASAHSSSQSSSSVCCRRLRVEASSSAMKASTSACLAPRTSSTRRQRRAAAASPRSTARIIRWRQISEGPPLSGAQMASLATTASRSALVMASTLAGWSIYLLFTASAPSQYYVPQFTALSMIICGACLMGHPEAGYILIGLGAAPIAFALLFTNNAILMGTGVSLLLVAALTSNFIRRQDLQLRRMAAAHAQTRREQHKVAALAFSDQLTGLPNRR